MDKWRWDGRGAGGRTLELRKGLDQKDRRQSWDVRQRAGEYWERGGGKAAHPRGFDRFMTLFKNLFCPSVYKR